MYIEYKHWICKIVCNLKLEFNPFSLHFILIYMIEQSPENSVQK